MPSSCPRKTPPGKVSATGTHSPQPQLQLLSLSWEYRHAFCARASWPVGEALARRSALRFLAPPQAPPPGSAQSEARQAQKLGPEVGEGEGPRVGPCPRCGGAGILRPGRKGTESRAPPAFRRHFVPGEGGGGGRGAPLGPGLGPGRGGGGGRARRAVTSWEGRGGSA